MKTELIARMEAFLEKDPMENLHEVRNLQREYQRLWSTAFETARKTFIDEGGDPKTFEYPKSEEDVKFDALADSYYAKRKEAEAQLAAEQAKNLTLRTEIIAKIRDLSQLSDNVGAAIRKLHELQTQWKEVGQVSPHKYKEVQADYSKTLEDFYYNLKIYRELQEHDLKKNHELKSALIEKLKTIAQVDNIKEAERLIKVYRNEWDEIGPVPNAKWEELKTLYKAALDEAYSRVKSHYKDIEEMKEAFLKQKEELLVKAKAVLSDVESGKLAKWNEATDLLLALQAEWKTIGKAAEKENERVWAEFRSICDSFFEQKKAFFDTIKEKVGAAHEKKNAIIAKAEKLMHSTDWQKTGQELIKLQEEWKQHNVAGDREDHKLYNRFRKACNTFFDARKKHFDELDIAFAGNLEKKEAILARLNAFEIGSDVNAVSEALRVFSNEWNEAGMVPMKDKKRLNDAFYTKLDALYDQLNIERKEKAVIQFKSKVQRMTGGDNALFSLRKEADHLKQLMDEINGRIRTYENNMGFFKNSKGSSPFLKEVEDKIDQEKSKLVEIKEKRQMILDEMDKLREPVK